MRDGDRPLVLAGPMGAGKTRVGERLATWLGIGFTDLDALVVEREGRSIPQLFEAGEDVFRRAERAAAQAWLARQPAGAAGVLALGGGALEDPELADHLAEQAILVHLDAPAEVLAARLEGAERARRPLLAGGAPVERLARLREARAAGYGRARWRVETGERSVGDVALDLLRRLYDPAEGPWRGEAATLNVAGAPPGRLTTGRGTLPLVPADRRTLLVDGALPAPHRVHVEREASRLSGGALVRLERTGGEGAKSARSLLEGLEELLQAGIDRDVPFAVAGGGTLTDLGGLLAHLYKRGLPLELVPTTLLGQLDAALGGKNGINLLATKNVVGTTRLPRHVHLDALFLLSLAPVDLRGGLAEALKSGLIGDPELVARLEERAADAVAGHLPVLEEVTARASRVKLAVVGRDLDDEGERRTLNLGHTLGHAMEREAARGGWELPHGDAVAVGMVFAARLAHRLGRLEETDLPARVEAALVRLGLPVTPSGVGRFDVDALLAAMARDKKRRAGAPVWALPRRCGEVVVQPVAEADVRAGLVEFLA
jgi:3-dehydroquinate synthetase/shikimate kinase